MIFSRDLSGYSVAVIKELPCKGSTAFVNGALLKDNASAGAMYCDVQATTWIDTIGLYWDVGETTSGTVAAGTLEYKKVVINPQAVFLAQYDTDAYLTATYSAGTWTATSEFSAGDWLYHVDSLAGEGLLMYVGSTSTTASFSSVAAPTVATPPASANQVIQIHGAMKGQGAAQYMRINLTSDATEILTNSTYSGVGLMVLDSFYSGRSGGIESLRFDNHDDTVDANAKFYSEIVAVDHVLNKI